MDESTIKQTLLTRSSLVGECRIWDGARTTAGYGELVVNKILWYTHRLSYLLFKGALPKGMSVCHSCDTPSCINPDHLWLGSQADNLQDARQKGRTKMGSQCFWAKLTERDIVNIRLLYAAGNVSQSELAAQFNVAQQHISKVINLKRWTHILSCGSVHQVYESP